MEIGEKVGHWEIIEHIGKNKNSSNLWRCRCNCGSEKVLTTSYINLRNEGHCKQCKAKEEDKMLISKFVGRRVGTWEVIRLKGRNKYGTRKWLCRCDCGVEKLFTTCYLAGNYKRKATTCKSCELKNLELSNRITDKIPQRFWEKFLYNGGRRSIQIKLTKEEAFAKYKEQNNKCALSGLDLYFTKLRVNFNRYTNASIDRIDSNKPYTVDNIQWVEKRINMMKQAYNQDEFINLCKLIADKSNI